MNSSQPTPSPTSPGPAGAGSPAADTDLGGRALVLLVAAAVLVFLALGLPQTARPFHSDEVEFIRLGTSLITAGEHRIDRGFIDDVLETSQDQYWNFHPPLYTWALGVTFTLFGESEISARGFGLACGVASLLLVFAIGRLVWAQNPRRNLLSAFAVALCAVNPFFLQGCLIIDIDGTVYTTLFMLLAYLALRLDQGAEARRLALLTIVFAFTLTAKMTTAMVFPVVLVVYHAAQGKWRKALGDGLVVGIGGGLLFLATYWLYARAVGLEFAPLFTHTGRSGSGFAVGKILVQALVFVVPLPLIGWVFTQNDADERPSTRLIILSVVALGLAALYGFNLFVPEARLWINWQIFLKSFFLITVPLCTPAALILYYGTIADRAGPCLSRRFERIDFVVLFSAAVLVAYIGVLTRGGTFSFYQTPVIPLLALAAIHVVGRGRPSEFATPRAGMVFGGIVALTFVYGVAVVGDSYFLVKYQLFDVRNQEVFASVVRWWARLHADDPSARRTLANYLGYQPFGLTGIWYAFLFVPLVLAALAGRRWPAAFPLGVSAALLAAAIGAGMGLSASQAAANYRTGLYYGTELAATKQMGAFVNASVPLHGYYLAPRGVSYYIRHRGYIDDTRYAGGYKHRTTATLNAAGELVLQVDETSGKPDALTREPIHFAIGSYPLLDQSPSYRVVKQFGALKLYEFVAPGATPRLTPPP